MTVVVLETGILGPDKREHTQRALPISLYILSSATLNNRSGSV